MMNLIEKAIVLAVEAHAGQVDKAGRPYILHPLHLMLQMETEAEMVTAVLHDVVEDTAVTWVELETMGFPEDVLAALRLLTHEDDIPYEAYVTAVKENPLARRVKLADLAHNMDVRRLPRLRANDIERLQKYRRAWDILKL
jgi:(p)ppGpp synthase/HD superfamily hydrolase